MYESIEIPVNTILYKGLRIPGITCRTPVLDTTLFYVTHDTSIATMYSNSTICSYRVNKQLKLFVLNQRNVMKLLNEPSLTNLNKQRIQLVTGVGVTKAQQAMHFGSAYAVWGYNQSPGQRLSTTNTNRTAFTPLCSFLQANGYDGYFAYEKNSVFHAGKFHSEIMLCDASALLKRNRNMKATLLNNSSLNLPLLSRSQVKERIVTYFLTGYSKRFNIFQLNRDHIIGNIKPVMFVAPGMAVKLYASVTPTSNMKIDQQTVFNETISIINNTSDLDISINLNLIPDIGTLQILSERVFSYFQKMCTDFIGALSIAYNNLPILLTTRKGNINPRLQGHPFTNKTVFVVHSFFANIDGVAHDLMDIALQHDSTINENSINKKISQTIGLPMLKKRDLFNQLLIMAKIDILGTSPMNMKRHPVTGNQKSKGIKDLYRLRYLCFFGTPNTKEYCGIISHLINIVKSTKYNNQIKAQRLRNVIRNLK